MSFHPFYESTLSLIKKKATVHSATGSSTSWVPPDVSSSYGQLNKLFVKVLQNPLQEFATDAFMVFAPKIRAYVKMKFDGYFTTAQQANATIVVRLLGGLLSKTAGQNSVYEWELNSPDYYTDLRPVWTASVPNESAFIAPFSFERVFYVTNMGASFGAIQPQLRVQDYASAQVPGIIDCNMSVSMCLIKSFSDLSNAMVPAVSRNSSSSSVPPASDCVVLTPSGIHAGL